MTWTKAELEAGRYGRRQEIPQQVLHIVRRAVSRIAGRGRVKWNSLRVDGLVVDTRNNPNLGRGPARDNNRHGARHQLSCRERERSRSTDCRVCTGRNSSHFARRERARESYHDMDAIGDPRDNLRVGRALAGNSDHHRVRNRPLWAAREGSRSTAHSFIGGRIGKHCRQGGGREKVCRNGYSR